MKKRSVFHKALSWVLTLAMVLSFVPAIAMQSVAVQNDFIVERIVDDSTMDQWKDYFGPDHLDTEFAGAIWTDKSVFKDASAFAGATGLRNEKVTMLDSDNNFLVALSAIASTKEIVGYSTVPTDTMLVLDLSGSMVSSVNVEGYNNLQTLDISTVQVMVEAANDAIHQLTGLNNYNRVGVVVYSGSTTSGTSSASSAQVLLPLGRYKGVAVADGNGGTRYEYLQLDVTEETETVRVLVEDRPGNRNDVWQNVQVDVITDVAVKTRSDLEDADGDDVRESSKDVVGGTYVQSGLFLAWQQFAAVEDTQIPVGNILGGTDRMPIMVLMSDGAPTTATSNYAGTTNNGNTSIGTSNTGRGSESHDGISFLTQLTAAWVRASMEAKYGRDCRFYTLGLGAVQNSATGLCVLDPSITPNTVNGYWDSITDPNTRNLVITTPGSSNTNNIQLTVAKNSLITSADQKNYVDKYFAAGDTEELSRAFSDIVDEIIIQSRYYPTLVTTGQHDLDGYVTFEDELGEFMEVKGVQGLVVGNTYFSGAALAYAMQNGTFGNAATFTEYGWELVNTVAERLGVSADAAIPILQNAWRDGQLHYTSDSDYDNYIGWYADADGNFLDTWLSTDTAADVPADAVYLNKSYGFLGVSEGNIKDSDMMHVVVMVKTNIANGHQSVTFKIPAALIPMVIYRVELEGDSLENAKNITLTREDAEPIRLLFEVGLQDKVNALTVQDIMADAAHKHETGDGRYYFYSNRWGSDDHNAPSIDYTDPHTHLATMSHLHPSEENERYYYIEDTKLYADDRGSALYDGNSTAYTPRTYITAQSNGGSAVVTTEYVEASREIMGNARQDEGGVWYIPKGTVSYRVVRYNTPKDDPNTAVDENYTDTLEYADYPAVDHPAAGDPTYDIYNFLGNNGRILVTPATGIRLSKTVEEVAPGTTVDNFQFEITLTQNDQPYTGDVTFTDADGAESTISFQNGQNTVTVGHGETAYLTDIPDGVTYSIRELPHDEYAPVGGSVKSGIVELYKLASADFVNTLVTQGSLLITKDVIHSYGDSYQIPDKAFTIRVDLDGANVTSTTLNVTSTTGITSVATDENGVFELTLGHEDSVMILGLEAGVTYEVTELQPPAGFTLDDSSTGLTGTIVTDTISTAALYNRYTAASVSPNVKVLGEKTVDGGWRDADIFNFRLDAYAAGAWTPVENGGATIKGTDADKTFDLSAAIQNLTFTAPGTYYFRVLETPGTDSNITYDTASRIFYIVVEDPYMSGALEITDVVGYANATVSENTGMYTVQTAFRNVYTPTGTANVTVNILKKIDPVSGVDKSPEGFRFGLYDENGMQVGDAAVSKIDGTALFSLSYSAADIGNTYTYEIREIDDGVPGVIYDTSSFTVQITISDVPEDPNALHAEVVITDEDGEEVELAAFTNTYELKPTTVQIPVTKNLTGRDIVDGEFGFVLIAANASFRPLNYSPITVKNSADTKFSFELTKAGTYYYIAGEQIAYEDNGITYDRTQYHVTVTVTDNGQGGLQNTVSIREVGGSGQALVFNNLYTPAPVSVAIQGIKVLEGRPIKADEFSFVLKDDSGAEVQTVTNAAHTGAFAFDAITYDTVGEYTYTVTELDGSLGGVTYDLVPRTVTVKVTDNEEGQLVAEITGDVNGDSLVVINNTYTATSAPATIRATKRLTGRDLMAGEFTFLLYSADENFNILPGDPLAVTNDADGNVVFNLSYAAAGDYHYVLREDVSEPKGGVSYDDNHYNIRVVVYDDEQGALHATAAVVNTGNAPVSQVVFRNYYRTEPVAVSVDADKVLHGKALEEGQFTFQLVEASTKELLQTVTNAADGSITFADLIYTRPGTYTYLIREYVPEPVDCYIYDETQYVLTVEVIDDGNGQLLARKTMTVDGEGTQIQQMVFENEYLAYFAVEINKTVLCNRMNQYRGPEGFEFELVADGQVIGTFTSDANGKTGFMLQGNYLIVGTYEMQIREVDQGEEYMVYDDTVHTIKLELAYDENGTLVFYANDDTVPSDKLSVAFENIYEGVPPSTPETGDDFDMLFIGGAALLCLAGMVVVLLMLRKKKPEEN